MIIRGVLRCFEGQYVVCIVRYFYRRHGVETQTLFNLQTILFFVLN